MKRRGFLKGAGAAIAAASVAVPAAAQKTVDPASVLADFESVRAQIEDMPLSQIEKELAPSVIDYVNEREITQEQAFNLAEFMCSLRHDTLMAMWRKMGHGPTNNTIKIHYCELADGRVFAHALLGAIHSGQERRRSIDMGWTKTVRKRASGRVTQVT